MTDQTTQVCPMCSETIRAAAKVCPFCQSRLTRWGLWRQEFGQIAAVLLLTGLGFGVFAWMVRDETAFGGGRGFSPHSGDLVVQQLSLESAKKRPEFWLSGFVSNRSSHSWRVWELEVRFLKPDGSLLDTQQAKLSESFVVQPAKEGAFRIELGRLPSAVSEARVTARVYQATDGNLRQDSD